MVSFIFFICTLSDFSHIFDQWKDMPWTRVMKVYPTGMLFIPINGIEDGKSGWCECCYFFAVILGANSLCVLKSAVNILIYMKMWKTKFPIFGSIRLKMSEPVTYSGMLLSLKLSMTSLRVLHVLSVNDKDKLFSQKCLLKKCTDEFWKLRPNILCKSSLLSGIVYTYNIIAWCCT